MIKRLFKKNSSAKVDTSTPKAIAHPRDSRTKPAKKPKPKAWSLNDFVVPPEPGKLRFHDLSLELSLMRGIAETGYQYCSPIQARSLPNTLNGHDLLGKAQTGTGKTAAFLITIIDDLLKNPLEEKRYAGEARALVIAPTRELVMQIAENAEQLARFTDLQIHTLVGGMDYQKQRQALHSKLVDIVIATPGRLLDFVSKRDIYLDQIEILVLDEADRMLDMGFIPDVRRIVRHTPKKESRQTLFFSATFSDDVLRLAEQWTCDPVHVEIEPKNVATETVDQRVYLLSADEKEMVLLNLLNEPDVESMIVFANRRDQCRDLYHFLKKKGIKVGLLSGEVQQQKRVKTLDDFKQGRIKVLVATDVAGRGIHIDDISHVVNFTLPEEPEDYVHRIGRTGRAGKSGVSISFASEDDAMCLPDIEALLKSPLTKTLPPDHLLKA